MLPRKAVYRKKLNSVIKAYQVKFYNPWIDLTDLKDEKQYDRVFVFLSIE